MIHTNFKRGTPLHIILKDGSVIQEKFLENKGSIIVTDKQKIATFRLRSVTIRNLGLKTHLSKEEK